MRKDIRMKQGRGWLKVTIVFICVLTGLGYLLGPSRIYGYALSKEFVGTVKDIRTFTAQERGQLETFAFELHTDQGEIHIATSHEKVWAVVAKGDRVRVRLCPGAPWSTNSGSWVNAKLLNKISKEQPLPAQAK